MLAKPGRKKDVSKILKKNLDKKEKEKTAEKAGFTRKPRWSTKPKNTEYAENTKKLLDKLSLQPIVQSFDMNMGLYRQEYCGKLMLHMAAGYSFDSFAAVINVPLAYVRQWRKDEPDFSWAAQLGEQKRKLRVEEMILAKASEGAEGSIVFLTKNILEWTDKVDTKMNVNVEVHTGVSDKGELKKEVIYDAATIASLLPEGQS